MTREALEKIGEVLCCTCNQERHAEMYRSGHFEEFCPKCNAMTSWAAYVPLESVE